MLQSMTGYARIEHNFAGTNAIIEIKALNSKQFDLNIKIPSSFKENHMLLRKEIRESLNRGKIELLIKIEKTDEVLERKFNKDYLLKYYEDILEVMSSLKLLNIEKEANTDRDIRLKSNIISNILKKPEVFQNTNEEHISWKQVKPKVDEALNKLISYRKNEGKQLELDLKNRIKTIITLEKKLSRIEKNRIINKKQSIKKKIESLTGIKIDHSRLEQELIYYLEKMDITEEKVRLKTHASFFLSTIKDDFPNGKKLIFISQEIGREINTIGAKASSHEIQKVVVQMKDELEKIKEQLMNVL